jgi:hypothetical protein
MSDLSGYRRRWKGEYKSSPRPGEMKSAMESQGLSANELAELPALLAKARDKGWMTWPSEPEDARVIHRAK